MRILDHGYVEVIESWGSDERIIESARMSTGKGFLGWGPLGWECKSTKEGAPPCDWKSEDLANPGACPKCGETGLYSRQGDEKLLRYLYENKHATPFEMAGMTIEIQAPIFVFREWHRHRTQSYSELSSRYTPLPDVNYVPSMERLMSLGGRGGNKQAGTVWDAELLTEEAAAGFQDALRHNYAEQEELYRWALARGVPKELARVHLPVGRYSRMRASANLRNWLAFLTLRMAPAAQWEIRQYADAVGTIIADRFPRTWELFAK